MSERPSYADEYLVNVQEERERLEEGAAHLALCAVLERLRQQSDGETSDEYDPIYQRQNLRVMQRADRTTFEMLDLIDSLIGKLKSEWGITDD